MCVDEMYPLVPLSDKDLEATRYLKIDQKNLKERKYQLDNGTYVHIENMPFKLLIQSFERLMQTTISVPFRKEWCTIFQQEIDKRIQDNIELYNH